MIVKEKQVIPIDEELGLILNCAVRYAMGRMSYVPSSVISFIKPLLCDLDNKTIDCFINDFEFYQADVEKGLGSWGMDCDKQEWISFYKACKEEQNRRSLNC